LKFILKTVYSGSINQMFSFFDVCVCVRAFSSSS